jgi:hypothetical protein
MGEPEDMTMRLQLAAALAATLFVSTTLLGKEPIRPANDVVVLEDPAGDATSNDESKPIDVVKVSLSSDGTNLIVAFTVTEVLAPKGIFDSLIGGVAIDTDNNRKTGGSGFAGGYGVNGIEFESEIMCENSEGKPSRAAMASVIKVHPNGDQENVLLASDAERTKTDSRTYTGKIKYSDIGVKAGQTIRLVVREFSDYEEGRGIFPDATLTLK